jgi:hypothetical protein
LRRFSWIEAHASIKRRQVNNTFNPISAELKPNIAISRAKWKKTSTETIDVTMAEIIHGPCPFAAAKIPGSAHRNMPATQSKSPGNWNSPP